MTFAKWAKNHKWSLGVMLLGIGLLVVATILLLQKPPAQKLVACLPPTKLCQKCTGDKWYPCPTGKDGKTLPIGTEIPCSQNDLPKLNKKPMLNRNRAEYCFPCSKQNGGTKYFAHTKRCMDPKTQRRIDGINTEAQCAATKGQWEDEVTKKDGYEEITGLCGNEKYAHPEWMNSYDSLITDAMAKGTMPAFNKDIIKDGPAFCKQATAEKACRDKKKRNAKGEDDKNGKYTRKTICQWDKGAIGEDGEKRAACVMRQWGLATETPQNATRFNTFRYEPLDVDFTKLLPDAMLTLSEDFEAMHKIWGAGGNNPQRGVHKDNIWMDFRPVDNKPTNVLVMQFQGSKATTGSWGIEKGSGITGYGDKCFVWQKYTRKCKPKPGAAADAGCPAIKTSTDCAVKKNSCVFENKKCKNINCATITDESTCNDTNVCQFDPEDEVYKKVGAILATRDMFGSGSYEVEAMVPQANDDPTEGMGFVWAMWTFGYQEMYPVSSELRKAMGGNVKGTDQLLRGSVTTPWFEPGNPREKYKIYRPDPGKGPKWSGGQMLAGDALKFASAYQSCGPGTTPSDKNCDNNFTCGGDDGSPDAVPNCVRNDAPYTVWASEIDIEIPANPQFSTRGHSWKLGQGSCSDTKHKTKRTCENAKATWTGTCNCSADWCSVRDATTNKKIGTEAECTAANGSWANPKQCDCSGHWGSNTINFNTWRGDDEAYNTTSPYHQQCVKAPETLISDGKFKGKFRKYRFDWYAAGPGFGRVEFFIDGRHVHTSTRHIPTRVARLVVGPWFGWWGGKANYDTKEVWIKSVKITPFKPSDPGDKGRAARNNTMYPQSYDQCNPDATNTQICDFKSLVGNRCEPTSCLEENKRPAAIIPACGKSVWLENKCRARQRMGASFQYPAKYAEDGNKEILDKARCECALGGDKAKCNIDCVLGTDNCPYKS